MADCIHTSVFEMFKPGIGPSSSHTMGPMVAAAHFRSTLDARQLCARTAGLRVTLHGSLAATGKGHRTDTAVIAGLAGEEPAATSSDRIQNLIRSVQKTHVIQLPGGVAARFNVPADLRWEPLTKDLPHPNTLDIEALDVAGARVHFCRYLSVGGGFVEWIDAQGVRHALQTTGASASPKHRFARAVPLMRICKRQKLSWARIGLDNEMAMSGLGEDKVLERLAAIWLAMRSSSKSGIEASEVSKLPGRLNVRRRAPAAYRAAVSSNTAGLIIGPVELLAHAYALAVSEENACGGRVVTAPTNGAAGVIPAAFAALQDHRRIGDDRVYMGLIAAGMIGAIIKRDASLSGAEMGCQGEVGSASAMAAGGIVEMLGGTPDQVEMAAEICIEHHLGMTCDPVAGLVQIPCIERNVMGAVKSLNAAAIAMAGDGKHRVTLDEAIAAMRQIGLDMNAKYKETALGGLAAFANAPHHIEC